MTETLLALVPEWGAVLGDQAGYLLGRAAGAPLLARIGARRKSGRLMRRAVAWLRDRQRPAVFYSRWLVSALGPYVNLAAGAARLPWRSFAVASASGEAIWVTVYLGLGYWFSADIRALGSTLGNLGLAVAAGVVAVVLGRTLWRMAQERD